MTNLTNIRINHMSETQIKKLEVAQRKEIRKFSKTYTGTESMREVATKYHVDSVTPDIVDVLHVKETRRKHEQIADKQKEINDNAAAFISANYEGYILQLTAMYTVRQSLKFLYNKTSQDDTRKLINQINRVKNNPYFVVNAIYSDDPSTDVSDLIQEAAEAILREYKIIPSSYAHLSLETWLSNVYGFNWQSFINPKPHGQKTDVLQLGVNHVDGTIKKRVSARVFQYIRSQSKNNGRTPIVTNRDITPTDCKVIQADGTTEIIKAEKQTVTTATAFKTVFISLNSLAEEKPEKFEQLGDGAKEAARMLDEISAQEMIGKIKSLLSDREAKVLNLVLMGKSFVEIADILPKIDKKGNVVLVDGKTQQSTAISIWHMANRIRDKIVESGICDSHDAIRKIAIDKARQIIDKNAHSNAQNDFKGLTDYMVSVITREVKRARERLTIENSDILALDNTSIA